MNNHQSATSINLGELQNKFNQVGEFANMESMNNDDQLSIYLYLCFSLTFIKLG